VFKAPPEVWPTFSISGWLHAGTRRLEKGRVVLLAENSTCTAILEKDGSSLGMNHPEARQNPQFCLNIVRWLSGIITE
jgi:hypothetical protein